MTTRALEQQEFDLIDRPIGTDLRVEASPRWVRTLFHNVVVADSKNVRLVFQARHLPVYYFPQADVRMDLLEETERTLDSPITGMARYYTVRVGGRSAEEAAWIHTKPAAGAEALANLVAFRWDRMDAWFEEDDEVFVHPRDPYHRVDVINSSRHIKVVAGGEVVASSGERSRALERIRKASHIDPGDCLAKGSPARCPPPYTRTKDACRPAGMLEFAEQDRSRGGSVCSPASRLRSRPTTIINLGLFAKLLGRSTRTYLGSVFCLSRVTGGSYKSRAAS